MNEAELCKRFAAGGERELEEAINTYGEKLLRYATSIVCNHQDAEDVVQEVFISAYNNRASFDGGNLSAWLYKITYNRSLNQLKKRKLFVFNEVSDKLMANKLIMPREDKNINDDILRALGRLKPKDRALVYGRVMEEKSYTALSSVFECSELTLRKRYERAKKKLAGYICDEKCKGKEPKV